jgi:hypothetical protein
MSAMLAADPSAPGGPGRLFAWPRVRLALVTAAMFALVNAIGSATSLPVWFARTLVVSGGAVLAFGLAERAPRQLPAWLPRWVLQLLAVVAAAPLGAYAAYWLTTSGDPQLMHLRLRLNGFLSLTASGILFGPWIALTAMLRQREAFARDQALGFQLERSELERRASDARLRLLQAQVQPHFLFNTLANVRALVRAGSPQAPAVLDSLIAYLRASVPHVDAASTTLGQELALVRAYLELMHMRMPDRLQYALHADEAALDLGCPPMTLLTLVENAVRHGIDPAEDGGRIEVAVSVREGRCIARVVDTGVGLQPGSEGLGTGLATLRERLQLVFGGDARLDVTALVPHGVAAEIEFPARRSTP